MILKRNKTHLLFPRKLNATNVAILITFAAITLIITISTIIVFIIFRGRSLTNSVSKRFVILIADLEKNKIV